MAALQHGAAAPQVADANCFGDAAAAQMERMVADFGRMYRERNEALQEVARAHQEALLRLARAAEYRDDETGLHIVRMGYLSQRLAVRLGEHPVFAELLRKAAPMHDIGKIGVPEAVLAKPDGLTPQERALLNQHPQIGADILGRSRIPLFQLAAEVALMHHERFDGSGYPNALRGEAIATSARIVAVVDFFDALTTACRHREAYPDAIALEMLAAERGKGFDPRVVDCFLAHADELVALRDRINLSGLGFGDLIDDTASFAMPINA